MREERKGGRREKRKGREGKEGGRKEEQIGEENVKMPHRT